ncbi:MAG: glutamate--tRNA ligase, partial [Candidatus Puniceispirillum sp.]|nr:glutamate--tRNA ligase [Candidatus Puniceispirillum sp.]
NDSQVSWHDKVRGDVAYHMSSLSDPVLMREDGRVIYTLASVVDDIDHGITHILRGEDHVTNSAAQIQLFEALDATPPSMGHMALLAGADGEGLSKRIGSLSIGELRANGLEPEAIASLLARIGTADPVVPHNDLAVIIDGFDISRFGRATAKFDPAELDAVNARIVQELDFDVVVGKLDALGVGGGADFWKTVRGNIRIVSEAADWWQICTAPITPIMDAPDVTTAAASLLPDGDLSAEIWSDWTKSIAAKTGVKGKGLFMPLRLALTGQDKGPEIAPLLAFMGRDRVIARLQGDSA